MQTFQHTLLQTFSIPYKCIGMSLRLVKQQLAALDKQPGSAASTESSLPKNKQKVIKACRAKQGKAGRKGHQPKGRDLKPQADRTHKRNLAYLASTASKDAQTEALLAQVRYL